MNSAISNQIFVFLICMYGGIFLGLFYDIYRIFRRVFRPRKKATYIEDVIFWLICSLFVFAVIFLANYAELRFYTFLGFITGFYIYMKIFSFLFIKISMKTLKYTKKSFVVFSRFISYPFSLAYDVIARQIGNAKDLLNFRKK